MNSTPTPSQAAVAIWNSLTPLPAEPRALRDCLGSILRQTVMAERDNPPFDRVCMDGAAISSQAFRDGTRRFTLQGTQAAGAIPLPPSSTDGAIEIMTGAVLPPGTDCVIPLEEYDLANGCITLKPEASPEPWKNIQRRGCDSSPDVPMLRKGARLGAAEVAVIASAGLATVQVSRQPRIKVISTGDELVEPGLPIADYQIRRSNAYAVVAALQAHGYRSVTDDHLRDDAVLMKAHLADHLANHDMLVLSGGVSKGKFDYVPEALKHLGVEEVFHQVAQRPGRPLWFGVGPQGQAVFGLPGNPVSTLICLRRYVLLALEAMSGAQRLGAERVALAAPTGPRRMSYFMPVSLVRDAQGPGLALPRAPSGSGDFLALAGTDGFVELPPAPDGYPEGFLADFYRW